jgi:hypothetical protein
MNNAGTPGDPFGVGDAVSNDMAALEGGEAVDDYDASDKAPPKKLGPGGIPMPAFIGICAFGAFMLIIIVIAVVLKMSGGDGARQAAMRAEAARREQMELAQQAGLRSQVVELQEAVKALQDSQRLLTAELKKGLANQDVQAVEQRVVRTEGAIRQLSNEVATVARRVGDSQPFESEMYVRDDLRILSIGNGVARVVDEAGREFTLQRGDRWAGLKVIRIRSDRRQITFSDGSVVS